MARINFNVSGSMSTSPKLLLALLLARFCETGDSAWTLFAASDDCRLLVSIDVKGLVVVLEARLAGAGAGLWDVVGRSGTYRSTSLGCREECREFDLGVYIGLLLNSIAPPFPSNAFEYSPFVVAEGEKPVSRIESGGEAKDPAGVWLDADVIVA